MLRKLSLPRLISQRKSVLPSAINHSAEYAPKQSTGTTYEISKSSVSLTMRSTHHTSFRERLLYIRYCISLDSSPSTAPSSPWIWLSRICTNGCASFLIFSLFFPSPLESRIVRSGTRTLVTSLPHSLISTLSVLVTSLVTVAIS